MYVTLSPAYGVDYKNKGEVLAAWLAGKDFIIESIGLFSGKPMNMEQADPRTTYSIRYAKLRKVCIIQMSGNTWSF